MRHLFCWLGLHNWRYRASSVTGLDLRYCARCLKSNIQNCNIRIHADGKLDE